MSERSMGKTQLANALWKMEERPRATRQPLEARKGKNMDSSPQEASTLKRTQP